MIKALLAATLLATPAMALPDDFCATIERTSHMVVIAKMRGLPLATAMDWAVTSAKDTPVLEPLYREIVMGAYRLPPMSMPENQEKIAAEYASVVALMCYEAK